MEDPPGEPRLTAQELWEWEEATENQKENRVGWGSQAGPWLVALKELLN